MENLSSSLPTNRGFIIYFHCLHPLFLFFPSLPYRKANVHTIVDCPKYLLAVKCFRFISEGPLRSPGAGIRPLRSLPVPPGESHRLQTWKRAVPHQSEEAQRYDPATFSERGTCAAQARPGVAIRDSLDRARFIFILGSVKTSFSGMRLLPQ